MNYLFIFFILFIFRSGKLEFGYESRSKLVIFKCLTFISEGFSLLNNRRFIGFYSSIGSSSIGDMKSFILIFFSNNRNRGK
jgi:hypothetical protein